MMACRLHGAKPLSELNAGILFIGPVRTNYIVILIEIDTFLFETIQLEMHICTFLRAMVQGGVFYV